MMHRHVFRAETPAEALRLCAQNNSCSVHSEMRCVDAEISYRGAWALTLWDDLILSRTHDIGLNYARGKSHIGSDVNDSLFIHFNLGSGAITGRQLGRDYVVNPGEGGLFVHNEPVEVALHGGASLLGLALPREATRRWRIAPEDVAARGVPADPFAFAMLRHYLETLTQTAHLSPDSATVARGHLSDLAGLWLSGGLTDDGAHTRLPATRQQVRARAIRDHVARHYADPDLTASSIGRALGLSERLVQLVLQHDGTHVSALLSDTRLDAAARQLADPRRHASSVAEIAFACGFNDLSTFYKAFAARFHDAPGRYRTQRQ